MKLKKGKIILKMAASPKKTCVALKETNKFN